MAYAAWLLGSLGARDGTALLAFSPASVWLCAGALIVAGAGVGWRARRELLAFARARFVALAVAEEIFLLAWLGLLVIRALNPDLWHPARGGEKPFDLALLTAVVKSPAFPPYDPGSPAAMSITPTSAWYRLTLIHLTGVIPTTAYNLAVPSIRADARVLGRHKTCWRRISPPGCAAAAACGVKIYCRCRRHSGDLCGARRATCAMHCSC